MSAGIPDAFEPYVARLREIPFVRAARLQGPEPAGRGRRARPDALLVLKSPDGEHELSVELKRTPLTRATAEGVVARMAGFGSRPWVLFAPYVAKHMARYLLEQGANYVDLAGNHRLALGQRYIAHQEGRTPPPAAVARRGLSVAGLQVLFAVLAEPELLNATARELAEGSGAGTAAATETVRRLQQEGLINDTTGQRSLQDPRALLDRWATGYTQSVRPRQLIGTYRTEDRDPQTLEHDIEELLGDATRWAFGGAAGAHRLVRHFRGERTVVHLASTQPGLPKRLRAARADNGDLILLHTPGRVAYEGVKPRTAHPLLIYAELLAEGEPRAREVASMILQAHLEHLR